MSRARKMVPRERACMTPAQSMRRAGARTAWAPLLRALVYRMLRYSIDLVWFGGASAAEIRLAGCSVHRRCVR